jgi:hypothetical protein
MNSLEFIDLEIANIREFLGLDDVLCLQTDEDYKFWHNRLQTFQQIKAELEAWYSVKKGLKIKEGKVDDDSFYEYLEFEDELFDEIQYEYAYLNLKPIKKALEVKENVD